MSIFKKNNFIKTSENTEDSTIYIGSGDKLLFKNNISGEELYQLAFSPSVDDMKNLISSSLKDRGFDKNKNYSDQEIKAFADSVKEEFIEKIRGIFNYVN